MSPSEVVEVLSEDKPVEGIATFPRDRVRHVPIALVLR